jgi:hypothetical protein
MAVAGFANFGELYRAAFAECDPEKKSELLHQVQITLAEWQRQSETPPLAEGITHRNAA